MVTAGRHRAAPSTQPIDVGTFFSEREGPEKLVVITGKESGRVVVLNPRAQLVGSSPQADLRLSDATVSRVHARLMLSQGRVEIRDLGSKNGTFIAENQVVHGFAEVGQILRFGRTVVRVVGSGTHDKTPYRQADFVGQSPAAQKLANELEHASTSSRPLILRGEPGVGRRRVARLVHLRSGRLRLVARPARALTKAAAVPTLHGNGSVLIEEFEHLPNAGAATLSERLAVVETSMRLIVSVTEHRAIAPAPRLLLERLLVDHRAITVRVPSLRERADDLPVLVARLCEDLGFPANALGPEELGDIQGRQWPTNLRGLKAHLRRVLDGRPPTPTPMEGGIINAQPPYKEARSHLLTAFERSYAEDLLARHEGNVTRAARAAGIDRVYLHRLIKKHQL